jgi:hypothetical protein
LLYDAAGRLMFKHADAACKDVSRMYCGSIKAQHSKLNADRFLPAEEMYRLMELQRTYVDKNSISEPIILHTVVGDRGFTDVQMDMFVEASKGISLTYDQWRNYCWGMMSGGFSDYGCYRRGLY